MKNCNRNYCCVRSPGPGKPHTQTAREEKANINFSVGFGFVHVFACEMTDGNRKSNEYR